MKPRKRHVTKQNENHHDDLADVEWHKSRTETIVRKLSYEPRLAS